MPAWAIKKDMDVKLYSIELMEHDTYQSIPPGVLLSVTYSEFMRESYYSAIRCQASGIRLLIFFIFIVRYSMF